QNGFALSPIAIEMDEERADFVFAGSPSVAAANMDSGTAGMTTLGYGRDATPESPLYLATALFELPAEADGKWKFQLTNGSATFALDGNGRFMPLSGNELLLRTVDGGTEWEGRTMSLGSRYRKDR
ncbi:MAG: hypothetical protein ACPGXK_15470, partial [Phycisphaerae bacterium]